MSKIPKINFIKTENIKNFQKKKKTYRSLQKDCSLELGAYTGRSFDISYQSKIRLAAFFSILIKLKKKFTLFQNSNGYKIVQKFLAGKIIFPKSANVYIFELQKRRGLKANLKAKYKNSLGRRERSSLIFMSPIIVTNF